MLQKRKGFTLVEFLVALTVFTLIVFIINKLFSTLNSSLIDKRKEVSIYNEIDSINTSLEYFKNIKTDITILSTTDSKQEVKDAIVQDEIYITDITDPQNYCYVIFKDNNCFLVKGSAGRENTTKLPNIKNLSIKKISKVLVSNNASPQYIDIDKNDSLIELNINCDTEFNIRLVRNFKIN